ncbi:MAG TPA: hypothetical protein DEP70_00405, partial [Acholeplasmataceae bacterium]|nr:hypothetical protein [Acholeplasmataceae bacterium]
NELKIKQKYNFAFTINGVGETKTKIDIKSSKYNSTIEIYAFSTDDYDYVSTVSMSSAKRVYFDDLYTLGLVTMEDYNLIVYGDDYMSETTVSYTSYTTNFVYVRGTVNFSDYNSDPHAANKLMIKIYDIEPFPLQPTLLKTIYTNASGYYSTYIDNSAFASENGCDIVVQLVFENSDFAISDNFFVYNHSFDKYQDAPNGLILRQDITFQNGHERNDALHAHQASIVGFQYLRYISGETTFPFLLIVTPGIINESFYIPLVHEIDLENGDGDDWDTVLHEFGHYVADLYNLTDFWPCHHAKNYNMIDKLDSKFLGTLVAVSEGWATYYSISSQLYSNTASLIIPDVGDYVHGYYDIEKHTQWLMGDGNEWVVARLLFDLADDDVYYYESFDQINWGGKLLFEKIKFAAQDTFLGRLYTLSEFIESLNISPNDETYLKLFEFYHLSAKLLTPANNSFASYTIPTFTWEVQTTSVLCPNNQFTLYILSPSGNVLLTHDAGNTTSYTLSLNEWNTLLAYGYTSIKWKVETEQTNSPATGPYFSSTMNLNMPIPTSVSVGVSYYGVLQDGDCFWYKFTASTKGYYSFYTTGSTDTYGEIFPLPVATPYISNIITQDNDSSDGLNFKKTMLLYPGFTVYIRVRGDEWDETGSFTFSVSYVPAC